MMKSFRKRFSALILLLVLSFTLSACQTDTLEPVYLDDKYDTYYEIFVHSFADSNSDGIGDLKGLSAKLDYVNDGDDKSTDDLGATGIWLMPIHPSPTYHKYDVTNYLEIDPDYGTLDDFDEFISEAHDRGIKVILDLVMNHTSNQHPWFKEAVSALESGDLDNKYIDYYFFEKEKVNDAWYPVGNTGYFYEGKFWSGMPDLNLDNEDVKSEFEEVMRFWLIDHNVDGFRLDAVKEYDSGNDPHNIEILSWINDTAKSIKEDAYIVGEVWDSFAKIKEYYESGIDSFFDFPFGQQGGITVKDVNMKDGQDYAENLEILDRSIHEINKDAINASFMSNHDTGRLAGFVAEDIDKLRLVAAANLFTSGNSFIYYGEEIGMRGSGNDENKRVALLWSEDDEYLTDNPDNTNERYYDYSFGSVKEQAEDENSLLNYYKKVIRINQAFPEISRGKTQKAKGIEEKPLAAFTKTWTDQDSEQHDILIVMNFDNKNSAQTDLSQGEYKDYELVTSLNNAAGQEVVYKDGLLNLPAATVALLKPAK